MVDEEGHSITPFYAADLFPYPPRTSEKQKFSVLRGYMNRLVA